MRDTRDTHGGENVGTPIGQCVLIGNFRRRLARALLVVAVGIAVAVAAAATAPGVVVVVVVRIHRGLEAERVVYRSRGGGVGST